MKHRTASHDGGNNAMVATYENSWASTSSDTTTCRCGWAAHLAASCSSVRVSSLAPRSISTPPPRWCVPSDSCTSILGTLALRGKCRLRNDAVALIDACASLPAAETASGLPATAVRESPVITAATLGASPAPSPPTLIVNPSPFDRRRKCPAPVCGVPAGGEGCNGGSDPGVGSATPCAPESPTSSLLSDTTGSSRMRGAAVRATVWTAARPLAPLP